MTLAERRLEIRLSPPDPPPVLAGGVGLFPQSRAAGRPAQPPAAPAPARAGAVVLAGGMPEPDLVALSVATAAALPDADFLLDTPRAETTVRQFLDRLRPATV